MLFKPETLNLPIYSKERQSSIPCLNDIGDRPRDNSLGALLGRAFAPIAQLVEPLTCNEKVAGSNPAWGSIEFWKGGFQSGQMGQTVNLLSFDFGGSNPSPPTQEIAEIAQLIEH